MLITVVDRSLEALLRRELPLSETDLDVSFDAPDKAWGAKVARVTVNLYLFDVGKSDRPSVPPGERRGPDGRVERRPPDPYVDLRYQVSAWAGSTSDEHELLGEVLSALVVHGELPADLLPEGFLGGVSLSLAAREGRRPGDIFGAVDGRLRPSFELTATCRAGAATWLPAAPLVERVQTDTHSMARPRTPEA